MTDQLIVVVLALVACVLGGVAVVQTKAQSLVAWAVVALGVAMFVLVA